MDDLVQWLRAQLDEDERTARTAQANGDVNDGHWFDDDDEEVIDDSGWRIAFTVDAGTRAHIVRHDPARVLREIDAKRQILAAWNGDCPPACRLDHTFSGSCALRWMGPVNEVDGERWVQSENGRQVRAPSVASEWTLRLLALPFADRPGYRDEWRP